MHTSERMKQSDFAYQRLQDSGPVGMSFSDVYPDYHTQDRVGFVCPRLEDGVVGLCVAVLGLATGFYDRLRSKGTEFFDYPLHHAFIGGREARVCTRNGEMDLSIGEMGSAWGWLDVWPETNWHLCPATPERMLEALFRHQVNRVCWPASFMPGSVEKPLSQYAHKLLSARLKSVWYYECTEGNLDVRASGSAADVIRESLERLPRGVTDGNHVMESTSEPWIENRFKTVKPQEFLEDMAVCFTDA